MTNTLIAALATLIPAVAAADAPKPGDALQVLVGTWKGSGTAAFGKDKAKVDFTWTCKAVSGKAGVLCTLAMKGIPGLASYEETDLFGYEPNSDTYHWFGTTNMGETHDHVAKNTGFDKLQFIYTGTQEGKPFKEVIDVTTSAKKITIHSESFVAGQSIGVLEGSGTK
jgi:hypothetical protein